MNKYIKKEIITSLYRIEDGLEEIEYISVKLNDLYIDYNIARIEDNYGKMADTLREIKVNQCKLRICIFNTIRSKDDIRKIL